MALVMRRQIATLSDAHTSTTTTVWPGEFAEVELPGDIPSDADYALEPRADSHANAHTSKDNNQ